MIMGDKNWSYLAVENLPAFLRGITSKNKGKFYCLNFLYSSRTENKLKKHENACKYKNKNILKHNHREKSRKVLFIIHADFHYSQEKIDICHSDPEKSSRTKTNKYTPFVFSLFTYCSFDATKNKQLS